MPLPAVVCLLSALGPMAGDAIVTATADPARQLVLDRRLFDTLAGVRLVVGEVAKDPGNPLMGVDKPWENSLNNLYPNVAYDPERRLFKLWYKCVLVDAEAIAKMEGVTPIHKVGWLACYADSADGRRWRKPVVGRLRFGGSTQNNIVTLDTGGFGVMRDPADPDPQRRYKMVYDVEFDEMRVRFSPDGLGWSPEIKPAGLRLKPLGGRTGDTHSNAFWDPRGKRYILITRDYRDERLVARSESRDFLHWQQPQVVLRSTPDEGKNHQTYCMPAFPYANVYLGLVMMYHIGTDKTVDCELAWSPDTVHWERVAPGKPLIPLGAPGSYDAGCIYAQAGPPLVQGDRLAIYYGGSEAVHRGWKRHCLLCRATLRKDGFAGYEPAGAAKPGVLLTRPLRATGRPVCLNADLRGGSVRIELLDAQGNRLDEARPLKEDCNDRPLAWAGRTTLDDLAGKLVRLRFELRGARLYSFTGLELD